MVMNKIDQTAFEPRVERDECARISRVWLSAANGDGVDLLRTAIGEHALEAASSSQPAAA
jgi:GTP-binding protein HflX